MKHVTYRLTSASERSTAVDEMLETFFLNGTFWMFRALYVLTFYKSPDVCSNFEMHFGDILLLCLSF